MLSSDCTLQDVKDAIRRTKIATRSDESYNRTETKTLKKLKNLHEFMEVGGYGIIYTHGGVKIDNKYFANLNQQKWIRYGHHWWSYYNTPTDLLHKLRGSADA